MVAISSARPNGAGVVVCCAGGGMTLSRGLGHAGDRLRERADDAAADRGFALLRDRAALVWLIESIGESREAFASADRIAFALGPGDAPPHLLVTRDGRGVTCLGPKMAFAAPAVPFDDVKRHLEEQERVLRARIALTQSDPHGPLYRAIRYAYRMTRAEFDAVKTMSPLCMNMLQTNILDFVRVVIFDRRKSGMWTREQSALEAIWRMYTSAAVSLMIVGHDDDEAGFACAYLAAGSNDVILSARGLWLLANHPARTLRFVEKKILESGPDSFIAGAVLPAVAARCPSYARDAAALMKRCGAEADGFVCGLDSRHVVNLVNAAVIFLRAREPALFERRLAGDDESIERVFDAHANGVVDGDALAALHGDESHALWRRWRPLDGLREQPNPVPRAKLVPAEADRVDLWRAALMGQVQPVTHGLSDIVGGAPIEALIPGDKPDPEWRLSAGVDYCAETLPRIVSDGDKNRIPGRNAPCWCGSGKRYKKCHGKGG
jgi:hypothetical protein